jgi:hypothetical protein
MPDRTGRTFEAIQGSDTLVAAGDKAILAVPGVGVHTYVTHVLVTVSVALATSVVALEDGVGGTRIAQWSAAAVGSYSIDFGPRGYKLSANTVLNLTVETANATVYCTAIGYKTANGG